MTMGTKRKKGKRARRHSRVVYRIHPYDHPDRWLCIKRDLKKNPPGKGEEIAYLVELHYFSPGQHACGCHWFEFHKWDGPPIKPCTHIHRVEAHVKRLRHRFKKPD